MPAEQRGKKQQHTGCRQKDHKVKAEVMASAGISAATENTASLIPERSIQHFPFVRFQSEWTRTLLR